MLYSDIDSFFVKITDLDFMEQAALGRLSHHMNGFNFDKDHRYFKDDRKGELDMLKSEMWERRCVGVITLQPKCYCLKLEDDSVKRAAKGVARFHQETICYEKYNDIYTGQKRA